jgi:GNAT superfamily N-acetyltransferase
VQIEPLAAHPELVDVIARWHWNEWGGSEPGSLEHWTENLRRGGRDGIPITFIALERGQPLGSVTLTEHDMPGHIGYENFGPWLAGAFVTPDARGRGIGAKLMRHAVEQAEAWGVPRLYLYTESASRFYEHLGWTTLDETEYEGGRVTVMTLSTDLPFVQQVPGRRAARREGDCGLARDRGHPRGDEPAAPLDRQRHAGRRRRGHDQARGRRHPRRPRDRRRRS